MKSRKLSVFILPVLLLGLVISFSLKENSSSTNLITIPLSDKHRGVCWVGGPNRVDSLDIAAIAEQNVNWISQTPFGWQRGHDNPEIGTNKGIEKRGYQAWWGERDEGLRMTTRLAREKGIKTILKPHIWLRDEAGKWRGEITMNSEEDWQKWFANYEEFIMHYAQLAESERMEMLCIGTELHKTCVERAQDWRNLIRKIRTVYSGALTYAANFSQEFEDITFWDELDYIGIQAYFPLTDKENPTLDEVRKGWEPHLKKLERFSRKYDKPILFTEAGYKSTRNSGIEPWEWPQRLSQEEREQVYSEDTQSILYEAMFREVFNQPYIAGIHLWKWYPGRSRSNPLKETPGARSYYNIDFTPQGKKAETIMANWFRKFAEQ